MTMILQDRLYLALLFFGDLMMLILLINSIFLYKQKIKDLVSLMLIFGISMCTFEIMWGFCTFSAVPHAVTYIVVGGYCLSFILFSVLLDRYLIGRMGLHPGKLWTVILYALPVAVSIPFLLTTPLTGLVFRVQGNGMVQTGPLFDGPFYWMVLIYIFAPLLIAIYYLTLGKHKRPADGEIPVSLFVFGAMVPVLYYLEVWLIVSPSYTTMSLPVSLSLVYLITNVSTHAALETQAHIEAVETDLRIASKIQTDALPPVAPEFADHLELNLRGSMNTAKEVGGDFFDYFPIDDDRICFLIADVSGKGTPAALFMMTAKTMIKDYALNLDSTSEIFTAVNARLCEGNEAGMFATAWIGILDTRTMTLQYTNAGHNYPLLQRKGRPCEIIKKKHGLFLAGMEFTQYKQSELQLASGDRLLLYTDGVVEAHNRDNELYGDDRLKSMLDGTRDLPGEQVLERIFDDVNEYAAGVPQFDDITMVVLTIK